MATGHSSLSSDWQKGQERERRSSPGSQGEFGFSCGREIYSTGKIWVLRAAVLLQSPAWERKDKGGC